MRFRIALAMVLGVLALVPALALGRRDRAPHAPETGAPEPPAAAETDPRAPPDSPRDGDWVELEGSLRLVGSEPFPNLVLTGPDGQDWYLDDSQRGLFRSYERQTVKVRGRVELREMTLANGRSLGLRRALLDAELLGHRQAD